MPQPYKLVTIVVEQILREQAIKKLLELGATGFSYQHTTGQGSRGMRKDVISGDNLRIECICDAETADKILKEFSTVYFRNYAGVAWSNDIMAVGLPPKKAP